jgi:hypothetical protein
MNATGSEIQNSTQKKLKGRDTLRFVDVVRRSMLKWLLYKWNLWYGHLAVSAFHRREFWDTGTAADSSRQAVHPGRPDGGPRARLTPGR